MRPEIPTHVQARRDARAVRLAELGFASYGDYLQSPLWKATRRHFFASQMPKECFCGDEDVHLHHMTYERLGEEALSDLVALCRDCHAMVHDLERRGRIGLDLEGLILDEERSAEGRAMLAELIAKRMREDADHLARLQAEVLALPYAARMVRAIKAAKRRRVNVDRQVWMIKAIARKSGSDRLMTARLRNLEERAYGWEGWHALPGYEEREAA